MNLLKIIQRLSTTISSLLSIGLLVACIGKPVNIVQINFIGNVNFELLYGSKDIRLGITDSQFKAVTWKDSEITEFSGEEYGMEDSDTLDKMYLVKNEVIWQKDTIDRNLEYYFEKAKLIKARLLLSSSSTDTAKINQFINSNGLTFLNMCRKDSYKYKMIRDGTQIIFWKSYPALVAGGRVLQYIVECEKI